MVWRRMYPILRSVGASMPGPWVDPGAPCSANGRVASAGAIQYQSLTVVSQRIQASLLAASPREGIHEILSAILILSTILKVRAIQCQRDWQSRKIVKQPKSGSRGPMEKYRTQ